SVRRTLPPRRIVSGECGKTPRPDGGTDRAHELQVEVQVVQGVEARAQDFIATVEVAEVGARVVATGVAGAGRIERTHVRVVRAVPDVDDTCRREQVAVAGMARGNDAVEQVHAAQHGLDDVLRTADPHEIPWSV